MSNNSTFLYSIFFHRLIPQYLTARYRVALTGTTSHQLEILLRYFQMLPKTM